MEDDGNDGVFWRKGRCLQPTNQRIIMHVLIPDLISFGLSAESPVKYSFVILLLFCFGC